MKQYPSISRDILRDIPVHVYSKIDGSNIRAEWSPKKGFYKFGTRTRLLGADDPILGKAISLVQTTFSEPLSKVFRDKLKAEGGVAYFEFHGPGSFAGLHVPEDLHTCTLIDVEVKKRGFVEPQNFEALYQGLVPCVSLLYLGKMNHLIEAQVRASLLPGITFEGVVCKAAPQRKWSLPIMFKVKTNAWIQKVRSIYSDPKILEELL